METIITLICATVIVIVYMTTRNRCKHNWEVVETEYSECTRYIGTVERYKNITKKCTKCGEICVDKHQLN